MAATYLPRGLIKMNAGVIPYPKSVDVGGREMYLVGCNFRGRSQTWSSGCFLGKGSSGTASRSMPRGVIVF